jgi:hypothetical protein
LLKNFNNTPRLEHHNILVIAFRWQFAIQWLQESEVYDILVGRIRYPRDFSAILSVFFKWQIICIFAGRFEEITN